LAPNVKYILSHGSRPFNNPKYFILHTNGASGTGYDLSGYINGQLAIGNTSVTQPHFQVPLDGKAFRYLDDNEKGVASYRAEGMCLSAETSDYGYLHSDINNQAWTPEQIRTLSELVAVAHLRWGIPLRKPTHPLNDGGVGSHTMWPGNVYSNSGEGTYGHHTLNGRRVLTNNPWTTNVGKICPGTTRKNQVQDIIDLAKTMVGNPPPNPIPNEDDVQYLIQDTTGVYITGDFVAYRAVSPSDIDFYMFHGLVQKNADGSARVISITDHRDRMIDMSPTAVGNRMAWIVNTTLAGIPNMGSGITPAQIQQIIDGVVSKLPKGGSFVIN